MVAMKNMKDVNYFFKSNRRLKQYTGP
jgi:hypothetical protein